MALLFKECKKICTSIPYMIFVVVILVFSYTQIIPEFDKIEKPEPNAESYGIKSEENPELIMPAALESLFNEFSTNNYIAYPIGFYKNVKLNDKKQTEIAQIISELTSKSITYKRFLELMKQADELIGGGSKYSDEYLVNNFGQIPVTYEEALIDYNNIVEKDKLTGAYARLFCDYLGMMAALLPVFVAVGIGLKDRKAGMRDLVFTRKASSVTIISSRYLAMLLMMMLPVLLIAFYATVSVTGLYSGFSLDYFAFLKYSFGWLLPSLMTATAVGMFFTELTDTPIAIAFQGLWWFFGMFSGIRQLKGGYDGLLLSPRHNILGNTQVYLDSFQTLLLNRIIYTFLSISLVVLTVLIYDLKRRGKLDVNGELKKIFRNRKGKYKA